MKLDLANFTITAQRRALNAYSTDYERNKFAEYLEVKPGILCLVKTHAYKLLKWFFKMLNRCLRFNC